MRRRALPARTRTLRGVPGDGVGDAPGGAWDGTRVGTRVGVLDGVLLCALLGSLLAGCATPPVPPAAAPAEPPPPAIAVPAPAPPTGITDIAERPAEHALLGGMRAYDDAQYAQAEDLLTQALKLGLASPRDQAAAQKHLAFIYCTTQRLPMCEAAFRAARQADPSFALSKGEAGHPLWGPVYKRALATP